MSAAAAIYSVSDINRYIKGLLDREGVLNGVYIRGELSNYKTYPSGHHYFSMKDSESSIRCVMFRREAGALRFRPENGMKVVAFGRVSVFPRDGQYQLYVDALTPDGVGELYVAFEQLKARLGAQGFFDPGAKKPLPRYPEHIALVTSPAGAAVRDMLRILKARWPLARVAVVPVRVQGAEAPGEIAAAIRWVDAMGLADLLITGRGGGSMEDLWAFNEEVVARAIFDARVPIISAVGHEPDITISDLVADLRAATPSNAAELAVPDQRELRQRLRQLGARMEQAAARRVSESRTALERCAASRAMRSPLNYLADRRVLLDYQRGRLIRASEQSLGGRQRRLGALAAALDAMSPLKVLGRGYAIARKADGSVVASVKKVQAGEALLLRVTDGEISCGVTGIRKEK